MSTTQTRERRPILTLKNIAKAPPKVEVPPAKVEVQPTKPPKPPKQKQPIKGPPSEAFLKLSKPERLRIQRARSIKAASLARQKELREARALLAEKAPTLFDPANPKPLAVGIRHQIATEFGLGVNLTALLLMKWTGETAYIRAVAAGGARYGVDGQEAGVVTEREAEYARSRLAERGES